MDDLCYFVVDMPTQLIVSYKTTEQSQPVPSGRDTHIAATCQFGTLTGCSRQLRWRWMAILRPGLVLRFELTGCINLFRAVPAGFSESPVIVSHG